MGLFDKKQNVEYKFNSRSEAFNYMLTYLTNEKGMDLLEASKQANEFAEIFSTNMGIPSKVEPPVEGLDKIMVNIDKIVTYADNHPKVVDFLVGALTLGVGFLTGKSTNTQQPINPTNQQSENNSEPKKVNIDWDNIKD